MYCRRRATVKAGAWFRTAKEFTAQKLLLKKLPIIYLVDSAGIFADARRNFPR